MDDEAEERETLESFPFFWLLLLLLLLLLLAAAFRLEEDEEDVEARGFRAGMLRRAIIEMMIIINNVGTRFIISYRFMF